ncbi:MAG TPA: hypothetical protein VEJ36_00455 [Nitrososphaerales archaeon]|nr:hypothetical protein [Nitrososphaerales archaeon]
MVEKTVTISLRISDSAYKALQEEAKKQNTSVNTLANQLFLTFTEYDRFLKKFHMVKLSTPTLRSIIDAASEPDVVEAGSTSGSSVPIAFVVAKTGNLTFDHAIEYLRLMGAYANLFEYSEASDGGHVSITLTHELGPKGSTFIANYVEAIFKRFGKPFKVNKYKDAVTLEF